VTLNFSGPPYDAATIAAEHAKGCPAVGAHFAANPVVGDCFELNGDWYKVLGVVVTCDGDEVDSGGVRSGPSDHTHDSHPTPVLVQLWLEPAAPGECP
jgi:hypothetical protein